MKSTQPTTPVSIQEKSMATIGKKIKPIPKKQQGKLKGGGNPWIDAS